VCVAAFVSRCGASWLPNHACGGAVDLLAGRCFRTGASIRIGYEHPDSLLTYPDRWAPQPALFTFVLVSWGAVGGLHYLGRSESVSLACRRLVSCKTPT